MKQIEYVVCPLCGRNRVIEVKDKGEVRWDFWDKETSPIIQIREGGGSKSLEDIPPEERRKYQLRKYRGKMPGSGFKLVQNITWQEAEKIETYKSILEKIKIQIQKLQKLLLP